MIVQIVVCYYKNTLLFQTPIMTLSGHTESVGSLDWMSNEEIVTGSWDHSLRVWDLEIGGLRSQMNSNCAIFCVTYSPLNHTVLTGCADKYIRLYDPRASGVYIYLFYLLFILFF